MPLDPALVGHESPRQTYTILADDVRQFASAIGDASPLFHDDDQARAHGFPAMLAPPTFVTRARVSLGALGVDPERSQVLHAEQEYTYTRPLHVGDQVVAWHRVASLRHSSRGGGMAVMTIEMPGQSPDGTPLFTGRATVIVREGAPGAAGVAGERPQRASAAGAAHAGQPIGPLVKHVTQAQIDAYAAASGDHNPIHTNPAVARSVGLEGTIAHGMLSMAFLGQLVTDWLAARPARGGWLALLRVRFQAMVRPEDTLTCRGALAPEATGKRQSLHVWAENQHGERVTSGEAEVALP
jgi:acyl dehydratase